MKKVDKKMNMGMQKDVAMMPENGTPERIYSFSDGVFAIIITIMILEFKRPESATLTALANLWPTWLSYGVSYLFIAIVWINHHFLMRFAQSAKLQLIWANFAHMFSVSFIPFLTEWIAGTRFAPVPVACYAFVFVLVNVTYLWLIWETLCDDMGRAVPARARYLLHLRCFITMGLFSLAVVIAFWWPYISVALIVSCLILYTKPEVPKMKLTGMPAQEI
jgi:uncharacterized membrane protein